MKRWLSLPVLLLSLSCLAQPFTLQPGASMTVEPNARVFISNAATFSGTLDNKGTLILNNHVDFGANTTGGSLQFIGGSDQILRAQEITAADFALLKQGGLMLEANHIEVRGTLELSEGHLYTGQTSLLLSSGQIAGGSPESYISGEISQITGNAPPFYPMGLNGYFNSITLRDAAEGDHITVKITQPAASTLIPGDSLIGLSDEVEWILTNKGITPVSSTIEVEFDGIDLATLPNLQTIRSFRYSPVAAYLDSIGGKYYQLGIESLENTDSLSYGLLTSAKALQLSDKPRHVSIGKMPMRAGPMFYMPNIFSPNALNEKNRIFRPFLGGEKITEVQMTVWDGYNKQMYNIDQTDVELSEIGWDGKLDNGASANEGVYYFMVRLVTPNGTFNKTGSFIFLR